MKTKILIFVSLILAVFTTFSQTQTNFDPSAKLKIYEKIITDKLPNGLTYYILKNQYPKNRAFLQLIVKAGSVNEDDDQKGLAHFCEHMAFNGTKNFPKKDLINFLESIGMKFGAELNAYTGFDQTVYMLEVPLDKPEYLKKGLLILYDWANAVNFEDSEIEAERGIIFEEWRLGRSPEYRMRQKILPVLLANSKYAERLVIGDTAIILRCPTDNLRRFYHDWYVPQRQAIVVIGDFDNIDDIKKQIEETFGTIAPIENPRSFEYPSIPYHSDLRTVVAQDDQARYTILEFTKKIDSQEIFNYQDLEKEITLELLAALVSQRLNDVSKKSLSNIMFAYSYYNELVGKTNSLYVLIVPKKGKETDAIKSLSIEFEKIKRFGFSQNELEIAKKSILAELKKNLENQNNIKHNVWGDMIVDHFLKNKPLLGPNEKYTVYSYYFEKITLDQINQLAKIILKSDNSLLSLSGPEKNYPTEKELYELFTNIDTSNINNIEDEKIIENLVDFQIKPGKIISEKEDKITNTIELTLSNGIKVILKKTDFKENEILLNAFSVGGYTLYDPKDFLNARLCADVALNSGVYKYTNTQLEKFLSTKNINLNLQVNLFSEQIIGQSTKEDFETLLQLINLYFTKPRFDENSFQIFIEQQKSILNNRKNNPQSVWTDEITKTLTSNSLYAKPLEIEDLSKLNLSKIQKIYKERFSDPGSFTFVIVGSIDIENTKTLIEKYLGSLPAKNKKEKPNYRDIRFPKTSQTNIVKSGTDPKSLVITVIPYFQNITTYDRIYLTSLAYILDDSLINNIREEKQWTYSISASPRTNYLPENVMYLSIFYSCDPERVDTINNIIRQTIENISKYIDTNQVNKVILKHKRTREVKLRENQYWLENLVNMYMYNQPPDFVNKADEIINQIDAEKIQKFTKEFYQKTIISIALKPTN